MPEIRFEQVTFPDAVPVDGYGPGFTRIGGEVFHGPILALATGVSAWGGYEDHATLTGPGPDLDVLFVGTGAEMRPLPAAFREAMEAAGVPVEPMSTPAACRTFNVLLSEGRRVGLALIPV
jgi:uncharacterized protein